MTTRVASYQFNAIFRRHRRLPSLLGLMAILLISLGCGSDRKFPSPMASCESLIKDNPKSRVTPISYIDFKTDGALRKLTAGKKYFITDRCRKDGDAACTSWQCPEAGQDIIGDNSYFVSRDSLKNCMSWPTYGTWACLTISVGSNGEIRILDAQKIED